MSESSATSAPSSVWQPVTLALIAVSVLAQTVAAASMKWGASNASGEGLLATWINPFYVFAIGCLGVQTVAWMLVLKRAPLSRAYPFMALVLPCNLAVAMALFDETLTITRIIGIVLISLGILLVATSSPAEAA